MRAVIDIGATSARMVIAEVSENEPVRTIEYLEQSVTLGRDSFTSKKISGQTIEACVRACRDFMTVLNEYRITDPGRIRAVATSAVAEASNSDLFLDRIFMATGLQAEVLDDAGRNRLFYFSILPLLESRPALREGELLVIEPGGGHTTAMGLRNGIIRFVHTYRFGAFRTWEILEETAPVSNGTAGLMAGEIRSAVRPIIEEFKGKKGMKLLVLGGAGRTAARRIKSTGDVQPVMPIRRTSLEQLVEAALNMSAADLAREYDISFAAAESFGPAIAAINYIASTLKCKTVYIGKTSMRDGLLREMANGGRWDNRFTAQIIQSTIETGRHYGFDRKHAENVTAHAKHLFEAVQPLHRLKPRDEVILTVAALLHDIGSFISNRSHHKHTQYLIENSDVFGLSEDDLKMTALVARYHRRAHPKSSHRPYTALSRTDRLRVSKLAALLRVADALDRSHTQRIRDPKLKLKSDRLQIGVPDLHKCAVEEIALREKSKLFEQVYGRKVVLSKLRKSTAS